MAVDREHKLPGVASLPTKEETRRSSLALFVIVIGVLITAVDTTIVVLALPEMQRSLHVGLTSVIWVVIGYLLVITLFSTQVGKIGDMFGRVKMYRSGFLIFILGSLACALAWNEVSIIAFRLLQGIGGALIAANSGAVIADTFPPERRGRAYGYNAIGWNVGAVLGVVLGGVLVTYVSWRWIFWINVPIGGAAFLLALWVLKDRTPPKRSTLDLGGMATLGVGLFCILLAMTKLTSESPNPELWGLIGLGLALLVSFGFIERSRREPMLALSLFRIPTMTPSLLAAFFQSLANFAVLFLLLMYLQGVRNMSPIHASLVLVPGYVIGAITGPIGGRISDRRGPMAPATIGLALQVVALLLYAQLTVSTSLWVVVIAYCIGAIGAGCFFPANNSAVMRAAPSQSFGIASGMLRTFSNTGMVFSFALAILVASQNITKAQAFAIFVGTTTLSHHSAIVFSSAIHVAFYSSAVLMVVAALLSASRILRSPTTTTTT